MKKNYIIDLIFISLSVLLAYMWVERPDAVTIGRPSPVMEKTDTSKAEGIPASLLPEVGKGHKELKARNIFAGQADASPAPNQGSYSLTGIVYGKEKRAFFKDDAGIVVSVGEGEKLADGSVVKKIDRLLVKVRKGKEEMEYRIFKLEGK